MTRTIAPPFLSSAFVAGALCLAAAVWIGAVPSFVSVSTFVFSVVVIGVAAFVALMSWRNAKATSSVAQLLHATEIAAMPARAIGNQREEEGTL